jgi:hypothetical protein
MPELRKRLLRWVAFFGMCVAAGGCQTTLLSDRRIASNTAGILGVAPGDLTISDRRSDPTNTYYVATTKDQKSYACAINGGGVLAMGLVNPPTCTPKK